MSASISFKWHESTLSVRVGCADIERHVGVGTDILSKRSVLCPLTVALYCCVAKLDLFLLLLWSASPRSHGAFCTAALPTYQTKPVHS